MPKQSRGFWCCVYCEQAFDQYGEAEYHERHECTIARSRQRQQPPPSLQFHFPPSQSASMVSSTAVEPISSAPWHHYQHQPPPPPTTQGGAPFVMTDPLYYQYNNRYYKPYPDHHPTDPYAAQRGMVPLSESESDVPQLPPAPTAAQSSRQSMMIPYESKVVMQLQQHQQQPPPPPMHPSQQQHLRYLPILGSHESSPLNDTDTLACRSLELFEVMAPDLFHEDNESTTATTKPTTAKAAAVTSQQQQQQRPVLQVGIRCAFCAESETTTESYIFPANTRSIGDSIRHAGFDHLIRCQHYPDDYKRQIQDVLWKRNDRAASGQPESEEEESHRRTLIDACAAKCEQIGIVDRHPIGMIFANGSGSSHSSSGMGPPLSAMQQQQQYSERAFGGRPRSTEIPQQQQQQYGMSSQSQKGQGEAREEEESSSTHDPQHYLPHMHGPQSTTMLPMMTHEFPFYYEHNRWVCKYCTHLPPSYRDAQYYWSEPTPPPPNFMDYHLSICREYQRSMMYEQSIQATVYSGRDPTRGMEQQQSMLPPSYTGGQPAPPGGWEQQSRSIGPTPPRAGTKYRGSPDASDSPFATPQFHRQLPRRGGGNGEPSRLQQHRDAMSTSSATAMIRTPPPPPLHSSSVDEMALAQAIEHLDALDESHYTVAGGNILREDDRLVVEEDRLLLTDYFYYLMKQLRPVRFSEADRRTRGGKRENVKVGYGGLQCIHCIDLPNSRKFFWSNVDRLANSFAEIPTHVLKCRRCPQPTKDSLLILKNRHSEQMSRLSRGSQKVFFRRMWRRLHQDDPNDVHYEGGTGLPDDFMSPMSYGVVPPGDTTRSNLDAMRPPQINTNSNIATTGNRTESSDISPSGTSGSEESVYFLQRPANEAAKALIDASMQAGPPTPSSRVLLAIPEDREWLSDTDCFVRRQLEVFCATAQDIESALDDRKYPIKEGQVGIRCIHCAMTKNGYGARGPAVAYPLTISGIFESAREIERMHLGSRENVGGSRDNLMITCENLPLSAKEKLESLKSAASSLSSVLRKYFVLAARALGLRDTTNGIRAGAEPIPIGTQAPLLFTDSSESIEEIPSTSEMEKVYGHNVTIEAPRSSVKRKADDLSLLPSEQSSRKPRRTVALLNDDDYEEEGGGGSSITKSIQQRSTDVSHGISILVGAAVTTDQMEETATTTTAAGMSRTDDRITANENERGHHTEV